MFRRLFPAVLISVFSVAGSAQTLPILGSLPSVPSLPAIGGGLPQPGLGGASGSPTTINLPSLNPTLQQLQTTPPGSTVLQGLDTVVPLPIVVNF